MTKPLLPRHLHTLSPLGSAFFIAYALGLTASSWTAAWFIGMARMSLGVKAFALLPIYLLAGQGLHLLAWVGHEGFHFNLSRNKYLSALLGILVTGPIAFFFTVGEHSVHWSHHRYTNRDGDPQLPLYGPLRNFWSRLLLARLRTELLYTRNTFRLARGTVPSRMAFDDARMTFYARLNIAWSGAWLLGYAYLAVRHSSVFVLCVLPAHLFGFMLTSLRPYVEHAGTSSDPRLCARSRTAALISALYFFNNFHLEHHLYPSVPCYRLPSVHRYLLETGYLTNSHETIVRGLGSAMSLVFSTKPYEPEISEDSLRVPQ